MNEDFARRLARLEARNGPQDPATLSAAAGPSRITNPGSSDRGAGMGTGKMILVGAAALIGLPTAALVATAVLALN